MVHRDWLTWTLTQNRLSELPASVARRILSVSGKMPDFYFARYLPLLIHILVAGGLATAIVVLSYFIGQHKFNKVKMSQYECGMQPVGDARQRFSVKFYLVAMLFVLFDVEAVFLYPWAVSLRALKMFGFWEMLVYIGIVLTGYWYILKKGVIDWNKQSKAERI